MGATRGDTESFILQVLGHAQTTDDSAPRAWADELPPLTSSNDVDFELYALIAIVINENVSPWYGKITSDRAFVSDVVHIVAHCSRALEQRLREVPLADLLFQSVARLVETHVKAWRVARDASASAPSQEPAALREVYHTLRPHPALQPIPNQKQPYTIVQQQRNDSDYRRLLSEGVLAVLLPIEDLQNPCLFSLVSEITADLVLGNLLMNRICDGVFIYDCIARAAEYSRARRGAAVWIKDSTVAPKDKLEAYGLLATDYTPNAKQRSARTRITEAFWAISQTIYLCVIGIQALVSLLASTHAWPRAQIEQAPATQDNASATTDKTGETTPTSGQMPVLALRVWRALGTLLWIDARMSWLCTMAQSLQALALRGPGRVGAYNGRLDR